MNPATTEKTSEKPKKSSKESGGLNDVNDNEGVIKKPGNENNSSKELEKGKSSKDIPVKEERKKAESDEQKDKKKVTTPLPISPDWNGFTVLNFPLPPPVGENYKTPEKNGEGENGGTGQSSDKDGKKKEDKETKTIVKTTAVPVTSPKTRPERWSFF